MTRVFAIVYDTATKEIRRLIDTSDDKDDSHLELVKKYLAPDETMEVFRQADFPVRFTDFPVKAPRFVAPFIGRGLIVDAKSAIDSSKLADISGEVQAKADKEASDLAALIAEVMATKDIPVPGADGIP